MIGAARGRFGVVLGVLTFALLVSVHGPAVSATTITVTTTQDELNSDGDCSLREAIQAANSDGPVDACPGGSGTDVITVPAGTYFLSISGADDANATGDLDITADLSINGAGAASTFIDGADLDRVFDVPDFLGVIVEMTGLTIQNGSAGGGVGIRNGHGGTLMLETSTVSGNTGTGDALGAIFNDGSATLNNSTVTGNMGTGVFTRGTLILNSSTVSDGIGIGIHNQGTATLNNSTVGGNTASAGGAAIFNQGTLELNYSMVSGNSGGGIRNAGPLTLNYSTISGNTLAGGMGAEVGPVILNSSTVSGNSAVGGHGGIGNGSGVTMTLNNSTVSGNTSGFGVGGIGNGGTLILNNSTVSGNASDAHGGIVNQGVLELNNSTVADNSAGGSGIGPTGGIRNHGGGVATLKNTIVADNTGSDCSGEITSAGHNLIETVCDGTIVGDTTGNIIGVDPLLGPLANNGGPTQTHELQAGSPAIDAGSPDCPPPAIDQRGVVRPQGKKLCDVGAFEFDKKIDKGKKKP